MKKTLLICATALLVASCSKDTAETSEVPDAKPQGIIFSAAQDNDTRTKLDGVNILWQRGDAVGISSQQIAEAVNYKAVIAEEDHDKQFATLHTDLNYNGSDEHTFYAYYPYVDEQSEVAMVHGSISTLQNGDIGSNAFMWATATVDPATNPRVDLHFEHPFTYLNIQLRATGEYQGATVEKIRIEAPEGKTLAGEFFADFTSGMVFFTTNERAVEVDLTSQEGRSIAALGDDYLNTLMVVNAEDLTDSELAVIVTLQQNGHTVKLRTVKAGRLLKPQTKVNLKLAAEEMETEQSDDAIKFADGTVETICVSNWDTNGDGWLSYKEAAEVQSLELAFERKADISSFDELQYFKGLTSIDDMAFSRCTNMRSVVIPENVTSIGRYAFESCSSLTSAVIPEKVTTIGSRAFSGCSSLANITLPNNLTSIEECTFENCSSLTSIAIPDNVTTLGRSVFSGCVKLTDVTIGNGIETIPENCFSNLSSLANITLPNNLTSIGRSAFESCSSLESIVIPDNVTLIEDMAFYGCSSLANITLSDNLTSIGNEVFRDCAGLASIVIPEKVTTLGSRAFFGCNKLTDLTIGNGIKTIPEYCFYGCSLLTSIVIPENVTSIGESAFSGCSSLTSIGNPENLTSIGNSAFYDCNSLTGIALSNNLTSIGDYAFCGCSSLTSIAIPDKVTTLGSNAFFGCKKLTDVTIGNGIEMIPDGCFSECRILPNIVIPEKVTSIGSSAFSGCSGLDNIVIPNNVTSIGSYAFGECVSMIDIVIPDNVTSIGEQAFHRCAGLERVTLPDKLSEIGEGVFLFCFNLRTFNGKYASEDHRCLIQDGKLIAFAPASLKEYAIPKSVTSIGYNVFTDCEELENITIPDGVTEIAEYTFEGCTGIKSVTISKNATIIGYSAFYNCPLTDVYCRALTPPICEERAFGKVTNTINLYVPTESVELYRQKAGWKSFGQISGYDFGNL